jgi:hypothetical protein
MGEEFYMTKLMESVAGIMPAFLAAMVARGFWWAILAGVIVSAVFGILGFIFGKINRILGTIVQYLPGIIFYYYVWHIRQGGGWYEGWWLTCVGFSIVGFLIAIFQKGRLTDTTLAAEIAAEAAQMNLPVMLNDGTRLDSMTSLPGKKVLYTCTLLSVNPGETLSAYTALLRDEMLKNVKENETLVRYRKNKVTFAYKYLDNAQQGQVGYFEITPNDYR